MIDPLETSDLIWKVASFEQLSTAELYKILKLRSEVFVVEQNCPYLDADGTDPHAIHLLAEKGEEIVAYWRVFGPGIKYEECSIGRVLTPRHFRQKNYGRLLMHFALQIIETRFRTSVVKISAQDYLIRFYSEFGFRDSCIKYLEDNIPHTQMLRTS